MLNKLAIIGGSGLYDVEEFTNRELIDLKTPWGKGMFPCFIWVALFSFFSSCERALVWAPQWVLLFTTRSVNFENPYSIRVSLGFVIIIR